MTEDNEKRERVRREQDESWEAGYSSGQFGIWTNPPETTSWPSHWRMGYEAAKDDLTAKQGAKS